MPHRLPNQVRGALAPLLLMALKSANVGVVVKSSAGNYLYVSGLPEYFPQLETEDLTDEKLFEDDWLHLMRETQERVLESGEPASLELSRTTNRQYYVCECSVQCYEAALGVPAIIMTFADLTSERKREDTLKALLREVSHRSKNLLAIIQSIATQTALSSEDFDAFVTRFRGRIAALSAAQDLVTDSNWHGAMFRELATRQIYRYAEAEDPRIEISGPDILLLPNGATHVGLALHELVANATAYGALSNGNGHIRLASEQTGDGMFEIVWDEDPGSQPALPKAAGANGRRHFGSTVLERVVPAALEGTADYTIAPGHVQYRLRFAP